MDYPFFFTWTAQNTIKPIQLTGGEGAWFTTADGARWLDLGSLSYQVNAGHGQRRIVEATEDDVVLTERVTGVPLAVLRTPYVDRVGLRAGALARWMLRGRRTKYLMRTIYALRYVRKLRRAVREGGSSRDYWQAGKSVAGIHAIEPAAEIVRRFAAAARAES